MGGEQVDVAGLGAVAVNLGIDGGLGADGAGDEIAHGRLGSLGRGDLAGAELLFHQRVVGGELLEAAAAEEVAAAVADMDEQKRGRIC